MKKRLRKLIFLKSFNNTRPVLILALFLLLISTFANFEFRKIKEANAGIYSYIENFTSTTYKDAVNTTGYWDTVNNFATLYGGFFGSMDGTLPIDSIPGTSNLSELMDIALDSNNSPYVLWYEQATLRITKWTVNAGSTVCGGTAESCWTDMSGLNLGSEQIPGASPVESRIKLYNDLPYVAFNNLGTIEFERWSPTLGWTNMAGDSLLDILGPGGLSDSFSTKLLVDNNGNPFVTWSGQAAKDIFFTKWTPGPGPCANPVGCWTNMKGDIAGREIIPHTGPAIFPEIKLDSSTPQNPFLVWRTWNDPLLTGDVFFSKWTPSACSGAGCWTKMDETAGYENLSNTNTIFIDSHGHGIQLLIDSSNQPYVFWSDNFSGNYENMMTRWYAGAWRHMDGTTLGNENITNSLASSTFVSAIFDSSENPYLSWTEGSNVFFTKWMPAPISGWRKMDGSAGFDNVSNDNNATGRNSVIQINSADMPQILWPEFSKMYFKKYTPGIGWTQLNGINLSANSINPAPSNYPFFPFLKDNNDDLYFAWDTSSGNLDISFVKGRSKYDLNSTIRSLNVNSSTDYILTATLNSNDVIGSGQTIDYFLSNDGGTTWDSVTLGVPHTFTSTGNNLRWRADLTSTDNTTTPYIDDLNISYTTKKIFCSLSPVTQDVGGPITVNASVSFTPVAGTVQAQFEQNNINYANVILSGGPTDFTGQLVTDINHLGQNDVTVLATDSADGQIYTCNPSVGDVWVKKSLDDIAWEGRWGHQALSFNGKLWVLGGFNNYYSNEVWSSADGLSWTQVNASIPWVPRIEFRAAVFDNKIWVIGGQAIDPSVNPYLLNDVWSSSDGINWVQETAAASWSARASFGLTVFNNELWVVGGCPTQTAGTCTSTDNQIWHSANGSSWTQMTTVGPMWTSRASFSLQSYNNSLWVIAGVQVPGPTYYNDVWSSPDGINWTQKTPAAAFSARSNFAGMPFNDGLTGEQMYIFGGGDSSTFKNDIYRSNDGITWNLVLDPADYPAAGDLPSSWTNWTARKQLTVTNFNNEIWVLGGREDNYVTRNDVWSSPDGVTWTLKGTNYGPFYGNRWDMPMVTFDTDGAGPTPAKLFVFGGVVKSPTRLANDVWTSTDGVNWTCLAGPYSYCLNPTPVPMWSARWGQKALVYNNKIWIIGGCQAMAGYTGLCSAGNRMRDIWSSSDGITWTQVLLNAPWAARYEPALTVYNNLMWFTGGYDAAGNTRPKDVYSSSNGVAWTLKTNTAAWSGRMGHEIITYNDGTSEKMYLMGGFDGTNRVNDVWISSDGITWTQKTASAAWNPRYTFGALNYNGQMFVFGGNNSIGVNWMRSNDVYSSTDGSTWTQLTNDTYIGSRDFFPFTIFNDQMWVAGGDGNLQTRADVWASTYDFLHFSTINGGALPLGGGAPSTPSNFYCEAISPDTIRWHFTDTATNETGFKLYGPDGMIKDSGPDIVYNLEYLDETSLSVNTQYSQRYVTAFNGAGESGSSDSASCYTLAKTPSPPGIREVTANSLLLQIETNDGNPSGTEYAIKEENSNEYLTADGKFSPDPIWQTYEGWGGANGIIISGSPTINVKAEVHAALEPFTYYNFVAKARNGDGIETAFSGITPTLTPKTSDYPVISTIKGVGINLADNSASIFSKIAFAQSNNASESRYIALLREFSFLLNIILLILIVFFIISIYSSFKYLSKNSADKKYFSLILSLFTKDPAYVFSMHAPRDEVGTFQSSYQKHWQMHVLRQKTLMRALGLVLIKLIILAVLIFGLTGFNHSSSAQIAGYNQSGTQVKVGDTLNYIIEINNSGAISAGDIVITDLLDNNLAYVSGSAKAVTNSMPASIIESLVNQSLNLRLNIIPASSGARITFDAIVRPGSEGATISNQAFVSGSNFTTASTNAIANPVAPIAAMKYSCNSATGSCSANPSGDYSSLSGCQTACKCAGPGLSAQVYGNGKCCEGLVLEGGLCNVPAIRKYSCNSGTGSCYISASGPYNTLSDCQSACEIAPPICVGDECATPPPPPPPCTGPDCGPTPPPVCTGADCGAQPTPTPPSPIISSLGTTSIPIVDSIIQSLNTPEAVKIAKDYITPALLTIIAVNTIPAAILLTSYLLPYLHLIFIEPLLFLFRRKRKKWGVVYNALSKVPVDLAVIRLFRKKDNKLVQTRVTDREGRYLMIIKEPGKYYISVTKSGFNFPTRYLLGDKQDSKYIDLYHGEAIEVSEKDAVITANIPLDPVEKKIIPEREVIFGYIFKNLRIITAYFGLVLATLIFLIYPSWITGIAIFVHVLLFTIFQKLIVPPKPKSWGIVYDQKNKQPLHYAVVRIFDLKFNKLLETQVTDSKGRYSFLVSKNAYQLLAEKQGYTIKEIKPVDLTKKEEIVDLDVGLEQKNS